ncbi:serine hydrolase [Oceanobacillus polygoni]|uniref:Beta-lactamase class A n=1 Tax=Oceanobacillus polygoni TaxID=1235259 RepID=A0A9X1CEQ1_9BACI|nr:serine hydrolase [Oceanobacillus polygoni]MBP2076317.1 beta-lactamase class A [Oceanobacillus polygoni]
MNLNQLKTALLSISPSNLDKISIVVQSSEGSIGINANTPRKAASIVKLFILAEVLQQIEAGSVQKEQLISIQPEEMVEGAGVINYLTNHDTYSYQNLVELMIIVSDNTASNILLDTIGIERLNYSIKKLGCQHTTINRKFMDHQAQANGDENMTTATDVAYLLKLFSNENGPYSSSIRREVRRILKNQQFNHKLSAFQMDDCKLKIYHKTGELPGVEHDAAIMESNGKKLEVAVLTEGWENNGIAHHFMGEVGRYLMNYVTNGSLSKKQ